MTVDRSRLTFGIKTAPQHEASYEAIARVWREADAILELDHAWLRDHMLPLGGDGERADHGTHRFSFDEDLHKRR